MLLRCRGCGTPVDTADQGAWTCPTSGADDDIDHVVAFPRSVAAPAAGDLDGANPFLRYRSRLASYATARANGWSDDRFVELAGSLDAAVAEVWGSGFRVTAITEQPDVAAAVGINRLILKDETVNVAGSHKARHVFGLALWAEVRGDPFDRLAIASCGNAAIAAAVIARAWRQRIEVFVPEWADGVVVASLMDLGARVQRCERRPGEPGDPCMARFREAVSNGAVPFGCQGPDNGLTLDGGRTIGWELAEQAPALDMLGVQLGGGALASSLMAGLLDGGSIARVVVAQSEGCAPFQRAWRQVERRGLDRAVRHRSAVMQPWAAEPASAATGILDDETYDWAGVAEGLRALNGVAVVATEDEIVAAHQLAHLHTSIDVDATGSAGLAGLLAARRLDIDLGGEVATIFTGQTRT